MSKLWVFRDIDPGRRAALAQALSIAPATASLLLARGVTTADEATAWMAPLRTHDPFLIPDIEIAIDRLHHAMQQGERVCFYGDYDVDGTTAIVILKTCIELLGGVVVKSGWPMTAVARCGIPARSFVLESV